MKKQFILVLLSLTTTLFSFSAYSSAGFLAMFVPTTTSCPLADDIIKPTFCGSFKSVAQCHCTSAGLPSGMCQDMKKIYNRMLAVFGTQQRACEYQKDVPVQTCMDDWNCYRLGGKDSKGRACSGRIPTKNPPENFCEKF